MPNEREPVMTSLYSESSLGTYGRFGIDISVDMNVLPDLTRPEIRAAAYNAVKLVKSAIMAAVVEGNKEAQDQRRNERAQILALFNERIFVEEIPNGYCSDWCCRHLPWFVITTAIGRFTIGWRKRVLAIDWTQTVGTKTADELFADEDVTKGTRSIHAWSMEAAARYIAVIVRRS